MTYITQVDWYTEVQKGDAAGHTVVHTFGRNDAVPNGTWAQLALGGITTTTIQTPTAVRIKAGGNAADTAAGTGAREITVRGIDSNLNIVQESLATAGAAASGATTATFWRTPRMWVSASGTYRGANVGTVTLENAAGGTDMLQMAAGEGVSQSGEGAIPTGKTGYLLSAFVTVDAGKEADVRCWVRERLNDTVAPMGAPQLIVYWDGLLGAAPMWIPRSPVRIESLSDIWWEARGGAGGSEVSVDFEVLLVDN